MLDGKSVLVIDDEPEMRGVLARAVAAAGGLSHSAASGREAVAILERTSLDLAVVDIFMADGDGLETIIELRRRWPHLKLIAMSGGGRFGAHSVLDVAQGLGADLALTKPIQVKDLIGHIERLLRRQAGG